MARETSDPFEPPVQPDDRLCPRCGIEMEPIETSDSMAACTGMDLCPGCYLVMWKDDAGIHVRQGVPMNADDAARVQPPLLSGEPEEC